MSRLDDRVRAWRVVVERVTETEHSLLAFGHRDGQPIVLKVIKDAGDEWKSGEIVDAFEGRGVVRVYDRVDGAMLLERLHPGGSLASISLSGADDLATGILARTIAAMSPRMPPGTVPTVRDWGRAFERYTASRDARVPEHLVTAASRVYLDLYDSQTRVRLLHGDLHHDNVLFDAQRGWLAIDPKGVLGEPEFEVSAALRNPYGRPEVFAEPTILRNRVEHFARELQLDAGRVLTWAFAQAVLSAIWAVEDGIAIRPDDGRIVLANLIRPMLSEEYREQ